MLGVFVLSFFISSVQVLILAFFSIFFTRGNYSKRNLIILTGIIGSYLLTHVQVFSFDLSGWHPVVDIVMGILGCYSRYRMEKREELGYNCKGCWNMGCICGSFRRSRLVCKP